MRVSQILNNNVAIVSRGKNEVIVYAKGLAFRKKVGQTIKETEIEKTYVLDSNDMLEHFSYLLANSDPNHITLVNQIIEFGEKQLTEKSNDYLSLTLLDHIEFAIKRAAKGQFIRSPPLLTLLVEILEFYLTHRPAPSHLLIFGKDSTHLQVIELVGPVFSFLSNNRVLHRIHY